MQESVRERNSEIEIRRAVPTDAAAIAFVLHEAFAEYQALYTARGFAATTPTSAEILHRMSEGPVWVAVLDATVIGTVAAVPQGEALYIRGMAVLPGARAKGIGRMLLQEIEDYAASHKHRRLFLSTTPFLARAIRLYEGVGFRLLDDGPHDLFGTPLLTMEKILTME